jgi:hypothetical protein
VDLVIGRQVPWQQSTSATREEPITFFSAQEKARTLAQTFGKIANALHKVLFLHKLRASPFSQYGQTDGW